MRPILLGSRFVELLWSDECSASFPLSFYRNHNYSLYTMQTDALDRFGRDWSTAVPRARSVT
jgi:hypothetical protein